MKRCSWRRGKNKREDGWMKWAKVESWERARRELK